MTEQPKTDPFQIGNAALENLLDRKGIKNILEEIREEDPEVWRDICETTGKNAISAMGDRLVAAQVRVKALRWEHPVHHTDCERAKTIFGTYSVWEIDGVGYLCKPEAIRGWGVDGDLKEAKAAAQADYDRRIRAALEPDNPVERHAQKLRDLVAESNSAKIIKQPDTVTGWQDISTAPKDGRNILLWDETMGEWVIGWYRLNHAGDKWRSENDLDIDATAWMPLPPAPEKEG